MNIKGVPHEPIDSFARYRRRDEISEKAGAAQANAASRDLSSREISEVVDLLNSGVRDLHERMSFSFHEKTQRIIVKVLNSDTNEVIREIPSRDAIKLLEHIQDFLGLLVDEQR